MNILTDMGLIQNAYQGFAKDNFTMLDNLKLGYGGTAAEMARLINDSGVLGREIVNAKNVSEVPLDKMYEAIHIIQQEMEITGTTAKEASGTISGSFSAFQAAWKNFLSGLGTGDDMGALVDNLMETGETMITNIMNVVPRIGRSVVSAIDAFLSKNRVYATLKSAYKLGGWDAVAVAGVKQLKSIFAKFWDNDLPNIVKSGANIAISSINALLGVNIPKIEKIEFPTYGDIEEAISTLVTDIKTALDEATDWSLKIFNAPTESAAEIKEAIADWWDNTARPAIQEACSWTLQLFDNPTETQQEISRVITDALDEVGYSLSSLTSFSLQMLGVETPTGEAAEVYISTWWDGVTQTLGDTVKLVAAVGTGDEATTIETLKDWWDGIVKSAGNIAEVSANLDTVMLNDEISNFGKKFKNIPITFDMSFFRKVSAAGRSLGESYSQWTRSIVANMDVSFLDEAIKKIKESYDSVVEWFSSIPAKIDLTFFDEAIEKIKETFKPISDMLSSIKIDFDLSFFNEAIEEIKQALAPILSWLGIDVSGTGGAAETNVTESVQPTGDLGGNFDSGLKAPAPWMSGLFNNRYPSLMQPDVPGWTSNGEGEGEDVSDAVSELTSSISELNAAIATVPGEAAASAAGAISGATVEMDGSSVGRIVLPYVSAEIMRRGRIMQKASPTIP